MSGPGGVVVLSTIGRKVATKRFSLERDGRTIHKDSFSDARTFRAQEIVVSTVRGLAELLARLERQPRSCIVRGRLLPTADPNGTRRLKRPDPRTGDPATFAAEPRRWLLIDLDGVPAPAGLDPRLPGEAEDIVDHIVNRLPPEFRDACCWWQFTSGQSVPAHLGEAPPDAIRLRLAFWLDRAIPDAELKRWAKSLKATTGLPIDPALYDPVQIHYIARPIFDGLPDPLPRRSGYRQGLEEEVTLALPDPEPAATYGTSGAHRGSLGLDLGGGLDSHLNRIGPDGYQEPIMAAVASFVADHGPDADAEPLKARIRSRIEATIDPARVSDRERYTSDRWLDDKLAWARSQEAAKPAADFGPAPPPPRGSPEAAQAELTTAFDRFFARITERAATIAAAKKAEQDPPPPPAMGVAAAAGLGKSDQALSRLTAPALAGLNVAYLAPEHRLSAELVERLEAKAGPGGVRGLMIRGREQELPGGDDGEKMCAKADIAHEVARLGAPIMETLCRRKISQGGDTVEERCEHYETCPYIAQLEDTAPAVRFMPHQYGFLPRPGGLPAPDLVIIDERFWPAALRGMNGRSFIPLARLSRLTQVPQQSKRGLFFGYLDFNKTADLDAISTKASQVFDAARQAGRQPTPADFRAAGLTAADCRLAYGTWYELVETLDITPAMPAAEQRKRLEQAKATEAYRMARLWRLLAEEIDLERDELHGLELLEAVNRDGLPEWRIVLRWSADLAEWVRKVPVLLLDADLDPEIARRFLPHLEDIVTIAAERRGGRFTQISDRPVAKTMLAYQGPNEAEVKRAANRRADLLALVQVEAAKLDHRGPGPAALAVTYQAAEEAIRAAGETPRVEWSHFNAVRGRDRWKDVSLLTLAGRPAPNVEELERTTRAIFWKDPRAIEGITPDQNGRLRYAKELRPLRRADGTERRVYVDQHPDPLCRAVLWQIREAELLQVIDRARLVWRNPAHPCRMLILTNIPLPIPVHELGTWDELMPNRFVRAFWRHGAMPASYGELARCYDGLWPSREAVIKDWQRGKGERVDVSLLDALIGIRPPFPLLRATYRRAGQRGSPSPAIIRADAPDPRAALEAVVGPVAAFTVLDAPRAAPTPPATEPAPPAADGPDDDPAEWASWIREPLEEEAPDAA